MIDVQSVSEQIGFASLRTLHGIRFGDNGLNQIAAVCSQWMKCTETETKLHSDYIIQIYICARLGEESIIIQVCAAAEIKALTSTLKPEYEMFRSQRSGLEGAVYNAHLSKSASKHGWGSQLPSCHACRCHLL